MYSVGDIVRLRHCSDEGDIGVVSIVPEQSSVAKLNPLFALYWVFYKKGSKCFTGSQLVGI